MGGGGGPGMVTLVLLLVLLLVLSLLWVVGEVGGGLVVEAEGGRLVGQRGEGKGKVIEVSGRHGVV